MSNSLNSYSDCDEGVWSFVSFTAQDDKSQWRQIGYGHSTERNDRLSRPIVDWHQNLQPEGKFQRTKEKYI